jgi:FtsH-binding integral membrane protein
MVAFAFGLILEISLSFYDSSVIFPAIAITGAVTLTMMILGSLFPAFFFGIARMLGLSLLAAILIDLGSMFLFHTHLAIIDYAVIAIFCGYIGFDWGKANALPKTMDNAIDSAANIYMDIINVFLRVLSILGKK